MARGRMLSTDVSSDPDAQALSVASYALYLSTIPHLDRDGLIDAHPLKLVAIAAPMRYEFRDVAAALINEWVEIGLVIRYQVSSRQSVLFFKGFRRHQQGMEYKRESASRFPPPPGWTRTEEGLVPDDPDLCFLLADFFHVKSDYRRMLLAHASGDVPEQFEKPSRRVREVSRSDREEFAPNTTEQKLTNGGGGVQDTPTTHLGSGKGGEWGGAPTRLISALAEISDDELRIAADGLGSTFGLHAEYTDWPRMIAGASRAELMLICAWCWKWGADIEAGRDTGIESYPAVLYARIKAVSFPGGLSTYQMHSIRDAIEDAVRLMSIPVEEL